MTFSKPWIALPGEEGEETRVPVADIYLRTSDGDLIREIFVVDSGADVSMGPRALCDMLGLVWEKGKPTQVQGISPRPECIVDARIHNVEVHIREAACRVSLPFCFAEGDAPLLLGREGFFDAFGIYFDKPKLLTTFNS
jgi:hypothetical protein